MTGAGWVGTDRLTWEKAGATASILTLGKLVVWAVVFPAKSETSTRVKLNNPCGLLAATVWRKISSVSDDAAASKIKVGPPDH